MVLCVIQARLGSTRLPGKILADLGDGRPMLAHVVERAKAILGIDLLALSFPNADFAPIIRAVGTTLMTHAVRLYPWLDEESDVLARYAAAAWHSQADYVVRVTSDCVFLDPAESSAVLAGTLRSGAEWGDNLHRCPEGLDTEVFSRDLLDRADQAETDPARREHVTGWMRGAARSAFSLIPNPPRPACRGLHLSVDTPADLDAARRTVAHLAPGDFSLAATLRAREKAGL